MVVNELFSGSAHNHILILKTTPIYQFCDHTHTVSQMTTPTDHTNDTQKLIWLASLKWLADG